MDFSGDNNGDLVLEDDAAIREVGPYVMAGEDTDPPTTLSYGASLYALNDQLLVRVIERESSSARETTTLRISEDGGRTWQHLTRAPLLDAWRRVDHVEAG